MTDWLLMWILALNLDKGTWHWKILKPEFYSRSPIRRSRYKLPQWCEFTIRMQSCFHQSTLQSRNARLSHLFRHMLHPSWQLVSILGEIYECLDKNWDRNMLFANHFLTWCILNFKKLLPSSEFLLPSWKPWREVSTTFVHSSRNHPFGIPPSSWR